MKKKIIRIFFIIFFLSFFCVILSLIYPKVWPYFDTIRMFIQRNIIITISNVTYSLNENKKVSLNKVLSKRKLLPGDIIFTSDHSNLGNSFIDGKWKHVLLYLGTQRNLRAILGKKSDFYNKILALGFESNEQLIVESTFEGVAVKSLNDLEEKESFAGFRVVVPFKLLKQGLEQIGEQVGKPYDFDFNLNDNQEVFCTELLYPLFLRWGMSPDIDIGTFRDTVSPNSMLRSLLNKDLDNGVVYFLFYVEAENKRFFYRSKDLLKKTLREE